jgi:DNA invertase Pin-like site-specific DNA recombinase
MLTSKNREKIRDNAIAYIRVSSQRQVDESVSIEEQKRRILDYAQFKGMKEKLGK